MLKANNAAAVLATLLGTCVLAALPNASSASCVDLLQADGYRIGWVREVRFDPSPDEGCVTTVVIDLVRSSAEPAGPDTLQAVGGACNGAISTVHYDPGGARTFSFAVGELAILSVCGDKGGKGDSGDSGRTWIVNKGTVWSSRYERTLTGVQAFHDDVRSRRVALDLLEVHHGFSPEVLRAPNPILTYEGERARRERDLWFLHEVSRTPSALTVAQFVAGIDIE